MIELHPDMQAFEEVFQLGLDGKNLGIPMGFKRLSKIIGLRRSTYYLIGGYTGSAKTTFLDDAFVLNPAKWWLASDKSIDLKIIYYSMERTKAEKIAKWISREIFVQEGIVISMDEILSWQKKRDSRGNITAEKDLLTSQETEKVEFYAKKFKIWQEDETFICMEGSHNPTGISLFLRTVCT
jgi:replicative DNA helicase